jgi:hypothetical protein
MADLGNFNASNIEIRDFQPIPAGWYTVKIAASEMKATKDQQGQYLELRMEILDPAFKGRVVFDRLNLKNKNQSAVDIAKQSLAAICVAVDVLQPRNSEALHGRPLMAKLTQRLYQGEVQNEVKGYKKREQSGPALPPDDMDTPPPAAPGNSTDTNW